MVVLFLGRDRGGCRDVQSHCVSAEDNIFPLRPPFLLPLLPRLHLFRQFSGMFTYTYMYTIYIYIIHYIHVHV